MKTTTIKISTLSEMTSELVNHIETEMEKHEITVSYAQSNEYTLYLPDDVTDWRQYASHAEDLIEQIIEEYNRYR